MEGPTLRYVCCPGRSATEQVFFTLPIPRPFVFELIGHITEDECYLTPEGYGDRAEGPLASCWIGPCPDHISHIEWGTAARAIQHILDTIRGHPWRDDVFIAEGSPLAIQLLYEPPEGETIEDTLPLYARNGSRYVPMSHSEVPFAQPM
ncbi:hypothetical protein LXA43DRAFT_901534 [Ganoderma leucocontextum]|nr:hypothetical protein LXA43DRAFT_901534 [Ganoderma leucocontextum]